MKSTKVCDVYQLELAAGRPANSRPPCPHEVSFTTWCKAIRYIEEHRSTRWWTVWRHLTYTKRMRTLLGHHTALRDQHAQRPMKVLCDVERTSAVGVCVTCLWCLQRQVEVAGVTDEDIDEALDRLRRDCPAGKLHRYVCDR